METFILQMKLLKQSKHLFLIGFMKTLTLSCSVNK